MKKGSWKKRMAALTLCSVLLGTSSPIQIFAGLDTKINIQQETEEERDISAVDLESEAAGESVQETEIPEVEEGMSESQTPAPEEALQPEMTPEETPEALVEPQETVRPSKDLTKETQELAVSMRHVAYQLTGEDEKEIVPDQGQADLSGVDGSLLETIKLLLGFKALRPASDRDIRGGDSFMLSAPASLPLKDMETPAEIREGDRLLATYTVKDQSVKIIFTETIKEAEQAVGSLMLDVDVSRLVLDDSEKTKAELSLPGEQKAVIWLPAASAKKETLDDEGLPAVSTDKEMDSFSEEDAQEKPETEVKEEAAMPQEAAEKPMLFAAEQGTEAAVLTKQWVDNNNANGRRPAESEFKKVLDIEFQQNGRWTSLTKENLAAVGLTEMPDIQIQTTGMGTGYWQCTASGLPDTAADGTALAWRLTEARAIAGYRKDGGTDGTAVNYETKDVKFYLEFMAGAMEAELTEEYITANILPRLGLYKGTGTANVDSWTQVTGRTPAIEQRDGLWVIQYQDMDAYELSAADGNTAVKYSMKADKDKVFVGTDGDYLAAEYNNVEVPNHGTDTDRAYEGGDLRLLLMGETAYEATKEWLDHGEKDGRPDAALYLWRYSDRDGYDFKTAAQVQDETGAVIVQNLMGKALADGINTESITFPNGDGSVRSLPKYDTDGYRYIYIAREKLTGDNADGYEQIFGKVSQQDDGTFMVTDKKPYPEDRIDGDKSVYNTGVLSNRCTGSVPVKVTKTWNAAAFQSQLKDVMVRVQLQSRYKGQSDENAWKASGEPVELVDFLAETLSKTYEGSAPRYDELGRELEYRWVEKEITYTKSEAGGTSKKVTVIPDMDGKFSLWLIDPISDTEKEIAFQSTGRDTTIPGDETMSYALDNRLASQVTYTVIKKWGKGGGEYYVGNEDFLRNAVVTFAVTQNGKPYPAAGSKYEIRYNPNAGADGYWVTALKLPEYDDTGHLYDYKFKEVTIAGANTPDGKGIWDFDHLTYDMKNHKVTLVNVVKGPGLSFVVNKEWLDDGDLLHREDVFINIYRRGTGEYVNTAHLTQDGGWTTQVGISALVPEGTRKAWIEETEKEGYKATEKYYIKEVQMGGSYAAPGTWDAAADADVQNAGQGHDISNSYHKYKATYSDSEFTVTNRRIGEVSLLAVKEWIDGGNQDSSRPSGLELRVVTTDHTGDVELDYDKNTVTLKDASNHIVESYSGLSLKSEVSTDPSVKSKDYTDNVKAQHTYNYTNLFEKLPKYAADGSVIHYTLEEVDGADALEAAGYVKSIKQAAYMQGEKYSGDVMSLLVTNKRAGTKSVAFAKKWVDTYAYTNGKRPDIFLTLYRRAKGSAKPLEQVTPYPDRDWYYKDGENYSGYCEFPGVAKYDENGAEYIYYATEESTANAKANDYTDVYYKGTVLKKADGAEEDLNDPKQSLEGGSSSSSGNASLWYLKEGQAGEKALGGSAASGYFENRLEADVKLACIKTWTNIPDGFQSQDLPAVKISAARYETIADGTKDDSKSAFAAVDGVSYKPSGDEADQRVWTLNIDTYASSADAGLDGKPLQRYDDSGKRYIYELTEAGVDITGAKIEGASQGKDGAVSIDGVPIYTIPMPSKDQDTWKLTNVFDNGKDENKGSLTVNKEWIRDSAVKGPYPCVDFTLYRTYLAGSAAALQPEKMGKKTLNSNTAAAGDKVDENGRGSVTFNGLAIYAPNGEKYQYYVVESPVDGYSASAAGSQAGNPNQSESVELNKKTSAILAKGFYGFLSKAAVLTNGISASATGLLKDSIDSYQAEVNYTNTYDKKGSITLSGSKEWEDYSDAFKARPDEIQINVKRYAKDQDGQGNGIDTRTEVAVQKDNSSDENYLTWDSTAGAADNKWSYTITNLERYASNGMPWIYEVTESDVEHYSHTNDALQTGVISDEGTGAVTVPAFKNNNYVTWNVEKVWADIADTQKPEITVKLQVSADMGATWADAADYFKNMPQLNGYEFTKVLNEASKWKGKFEKLPVGFEQNNVFTEFQYRAVETQIGTEAVSLKTAPADTSNIYEDDNSIFAITQKDEASTKTSTITNTLKTDKTTSLTIHKIWSDQENRFETRPLNESGKWQVQFEIWRKISGDDASAEEQVLGNDGSPYLVTIDADTLDGKRIVKNLPANAYSDPAKQYLYFAKEIKPEGSSLKESDGGYTATGEGPAASAGDSANGYTSTVTNTMKTTAISGSKTWMGDSDGLGAFRPKIQDGTCPDVTMTLWSTTDPAAKTGWTEVTGVTPQWTNAAGGDIWSWTYTNLPVTDGKGDRYSYSVTEGAAGYHASYDNTNAEPPMSEGASTGAVAGDSADRAFNKSMITNTLTEFSVIKTAKTTDGGTAIPFGDGTPGADGQPASIKPKSEIVLGIYKAEGSQKVKAAEWKMDANGTIFAKVSKGGAGDGEIWIDMPAEGRGRLQGLPMGRYTLVEEGVPKGYKKAADISFEISADGRLAAGTGVSNDGVSLVMADEPTRISIHKTGEDGAAAGLIGAELSLTGKFVNVPAEGAPDAGGVTWSRDESDPEVYTAAWTSKDTAQVFEGCLIAGENYILKETAAPAGYCLEEKEARFRLDTDGTIDTYDGSSWPADSWVTPGMDAVSLTAKNEKTKILVEKIGKKDLDGQETQPVAGAVLAIRSDLNHAPGQIAEIDGMPVTWTTREENGSVTAEEIKGLPAGTYWLTEETAPMDYLAADPIKFTLGQNGELAVLGENGTETPTPDLTITMVDETFRGSVILTKTGKKMGDESASPLEGVTLNLYRRSKDVPEPAADERIVNAAVDDLAPEEEKYTFTTDESGQVAIDGLRGGNYYFIETGIGASNEGDGYYLPKGPVGNFAVTSANSGSADSPAIAVSIVNSDFVTHVKLTKADAADTDTKLAGAEFTLTRRTGDGGIDPDFIPKTFKTAADGALDFEILDSGSYTLEETKAPYGCQLGSKPYKADFQIPDGMAQDALNGAVLDLSTKTGRVTKDGASEAELQKMLASYQLRLPEEFYDDGVNGILNPRGTGTAFLQKVDEGSQPLSGVTFTLYQKASAVGMGEFVTGNRYAYVPGNGFSSSAASAGILIIEGLPWGEYYLKETKADGYEIPETEYAFAIGSTRGVLGTAPSGMTGDWYQDSGMEINLGEIQNKKSQISIRKGLTTDVGTFEGVSGAKFILEGRFLGDHTGETGWEKISDQPDKNYRFTWTSSEQAQSFAGVLAAGETYTLTEASVDDSGNKIIPNGALPLNADALFTLTIGQDGKVASVAADGGNSDAAEIAVEEDALSVVVKDDPTRLRIYKKGMDNASNGDGDPLLEECTFKVEPLDGSAFAPDRARTRIGKDAAIYVTTTGNAEEENELTGRLLIGGKYRITEVTPPVGYELGIDMVFTVGYDIKNGKCNTAIVPDAVDGTNYDLTYDNDGNPIITQRDNPITAWIQKTDSAADQGLNGAKFTVQGFLEGDQVLNADGIGSQGPVEFVTESVTSQAGVTTDGILDLSKRLQESNDRDGIEHIYILTETQSPGGYAQLERPIYFKLDSVWVDGKDIILNSPDDGTKPAGAVMRKSVFRILYQEDVSQGMQDAGQYTPDTYKSKLDAGNGTPGGIVSNPLLLTVSNERSSNPPSTTWHTAAKFWNDNGDAAGKRLDFVQVKLQQKQADGSYDDVAGQPMLTLDEKNGWSNTWPGLPYGREYRAVEVTDLDGTGYTSSYNTSGTNTVITNTYMEETETPTPTPKPSQTPTPTPSDTPDPTDKPEPSDTPGPTKQPSPTGTPIVSPTGAASPTVTSRPSVTWALKRPGTTWNSGAPSEGNTTKAQSTRTGDGTDVQGILTLLGFSAAAAALIAGYLGKKKGKRNK